MGTSTTRHARHLLGSLESSSRSAAGHAALAACFFTLLLAFFRAFSVLGKNGSRHPKPSALKAKKKAKKTSVKKQAARAA